MIAKFCGATSVREVRSLAAAGAELVGLWHGVPGGSADLPRSALDRLSATALETGRLLPVLVTFAGDAAELLCAVAESGVPWVQLHGYQPPSVVRELKRHAPHGITVVKALHVRQDQCLEQPLIGAYERAGTDCFLLDAATEDGRLGSTGRSLHSSVVTALADRLARPFLLAGGVRAGNRDDYGAVVAHPRFLGIDVDSAARGEDGLLHGELAAAVKRSWQTGQQQPTHETSQEESQEESQEKSAV